MAVLEKIRKRSALLFIIIIGALLAFILGDFLNSGRTFFGPGDTYAEVGDVKLKANRFAELQSQMEKQAQNMDGDYLTDQVIMQGLMEGLYDREFDRMGIEVSDNLLSKMVYDPRNYGMVFSSLVSSEEELGQLAQMGLWQGQYVQSGYQQVPYIDLTVYRDAIEKPANYKLDENTAKYLSDRWEKMEGEVERQVKTALYQNMLAGLFQPNKADALVQYENMNNRYDINYVAVSTAAAGDVKVEDADIQDVYEKNKGIFRLLDEKREVAYIYVPVVPSATDYTNARAEFAKAQAALESTEGTVALNKFKGFTKQEGKMTDKEIVAAAQQSRDSRLMTIVNDSSAHAGEVRVLPSMQNSMSMVKILGIDKAYDNISLSLMSSQDKKELDSIFADNTPEAVDKAFADNTAKGAFTGTASLASNSDQLGAIINQTKNLKNTVENAPLNQLTIVTDTVNGQVASFAVLVKERKDLVPVYNLALVEYKIHPSTETRNKLTQDLNNFVANNGNAEAFAEKAAEEGYNVVYNVVDESSYTIGANDYTPGSRKIVKWVMNHDKGEVSPMFTLSGKDADNYLVAVAVTDIFDGDYIPANSNYAKQMLNAFALENKKAKTLVNKYAGKGKTLADYAKAMGAEVNTNTVVFGDPYSLGSTAKGVVAGAKKGSVVGPVAGNGQVYVVEVTDVKAADMTKADLEQLFGQIQSGYGSTTFKRINITPQLFTGDRKIKNNMLYFTADEGQDK